MRLTAFRGLHILMGMLAVIAGAAVMYLGDRLLGINLELYYGIDTFNPVWIVTLFFVPFVAGLVVSFVFGLGGKILAYIPAVLVRGFNYIYLDVSNTVPSGATLLPIGYWLLVVILAVEAAAIGGVIGEIVIKKTYGRSDKRKLHRRYQTSPTAANASVVLDVNK